MADKILILDDEPDYAAMLGDIVASHGFVADVSSSPRAAVEMLRSQRYACVLSDYKMPELDGAQFLQEVQGINPHLPVIMVSGLMDMPELLKVANIGVTLVLEKPVSSKVLVSHLKRFAEPREAASPRPADEREADGQATRRCRSISDVGDRFWFEVASAALAGPVCLQGEQGAEFALVAREIVEQSGQSPLRIRHVCFDDFIRARFQGSDASAVVVEVEDPDAFEATDLASSPVLAELQRDRVPLLFVMAPDSLVGSREEIGGIPAFHIPPLTERPGDVAVYGQRILAASQSGDRHLSSEAIRLLLDYPWPGNYTELLAALGRAVILQSSGAITFETLRKAILYRHGSVSEQSRTMELRDFLLKEQERFLSGGSSDDVVELVNRISTNRGDEQAEECSVASEQDGFGS